MDAQVVDVPFQDTNPEVHIVSQMPKVEQVMFYSGNNVYSVDLSAIERGEGNINISLEDFRSHSNELAGYRAQHGETEYYAMLANLNTEKESEHTVGKILQYNAGSVKIYDSENPYIPQHYSKEESLNFMRAYAAGLIDGASMTDSRYSDESKVALGIDKEELQRNVELGKAILKYEGRLRDDVYTAEDVQSVFNTIAEREMDRLRQKDRESGAIVDIPTFDTRINEVGVKSIEAGVKRIQSDDSLALKAMGDFNRCLRDFDQKLEVTRNFSSMTKNFQSHKGVDFSPVSSQSWEVGLPGNRVEDKPYVIDSPDDIRKDFASMFKNFQEHKGVDFRYVNEENRPLVSFSIKPHVVETKREEMPVEVVFEQKHGSSKDKGRA